MLTTKVITALYVIPYIYCHIITGPDFPIDIQKSGRFGIYSIPYSILLSATLTAITKDPTYQYINITPITVIASYTIIELVKEMRR